MADVYLVSGDLSVQFTRAFRDWLDAGNARVDGVRVESGKFLETRSAYQDFLARTWGNQNDVLERHVERVLDRVRGQGWEGLDINRLVIVPTYSTHALMEGRVEQVYIGGADVGRLEWHYAVTCLCGDAVKYFFDEAPVIEQLEDCDVVFEQSHIRPSNIADKKAAEDAKTNPMNADVQEKVVFYGAELTKPERQGDREVITRARQWSSKSLSFPDLDGAGHLDDNSTPDGSQSVSAPIRQEGHSMFDELPDPVDPKETQRKNDEAEAEKEQRIITEAMLTGLRVSAIAQDYGYDRYAAEQLERNAKGEIARREAEQADELRELNQKVAKGTDLSDVIDQFMASGGFKEPKEEGDPFSAREGWCSADNPCSDCERDDNPPEAVSPVPDPLTTTESRAYTRFRGSHFRGDKDPTTTPCNVCGIKHGNGWWKVDAIRVLAKDSEGL